MLNRESTIELTVEYFIQQSGLYGKEFYSDLDFSIDEKNAGPEKLSKFSGFLQFFNRFHFDIF